jgi:hypothetical protein
MDHSGLAAPAPAKTSVPVEDQVHTHEVRDLESQDSKTPEYNSDIDEKHAGGVNEKNFSPELTQGSMEDEDTRPLDKEEKRKALYRKLKPFMYLFIWLVMTG